MCVPEMKLPRFLASPPSPQTVVFACFVGEKGPLFVTA